MAGTWACSGAARYPPHLGLASPFRTLLEALGLAKAGLRMQLAMCACHCLLAYVAGQVWHTCTYALLYTKVLLTGQILLDLA